MGHNDELPQPPQHIYMQPPEHAATQPQPSPPQPVFTGHSPPVYEDQSQTGPSQPVYVATCPPANPAPSTLRMHFGVKSQRVTCPYCQQFQDTVVERNRCTLVNWIVTLSTCICCIFCVPATSRMTHICSKCGAYIGDNRML
jgi:hypothetical protein